MNLVALHKVDGFDTWGAKKGKRIVFNFDYVKKFYETHEGSFEHGRAWRWPYCGGMVTHVIDDRGNDTWVVESQSEIEEMLMHKEEKNNE